MDAAHKVLAKPSTSLGIFVLSVTLQVACCSLDAPDALAWELLGALVLALGLSGAAVGLVSYKRGVGRLLPFTGFVLNAVHVALMACGLVTSWHFRIRR